MNLIDKFIEDYTNGRRKNGETGITSQVIFPEISLSAKDLNHIKQLSEKEKTMVSKPIYIESSTENLLLWIKEGKFIDHFTDKEIILPSELEIKNIRYLSERELENILNQWGRKNEY